MANTGTMTIVATITAAPLVQTDLTIVKTINATSFTL